MRKNIDFDELFIECNIPKTLSKERTNELIKRCHSGDENSRKIVITHNIRLVIYRVINRFYSSINNGVYEEKDLVSVGFIGLMKAIDTFNIDGAAAFSNYAIRCIDNEIILFLKKENKYSILNSKKINLEDNIIIQDDDFVTEYEEKNTYKFLLETLQMLPDRDRKILMLYFGFKNDKLYTQQEIANKFNMSRSNVSTLITKNLKKLRDILIDNNVIEKTPKIKK